ncbi:hypothetical protein [Allonocardiopsis opalescens]|uniref:Uncharacterized protein n=1 Tax=Allonocardiopsis opalescens TaxID=1144618 RepID=A0A2T0Q0R3_9ACTN|nr:hypothetical protein [Allonocardiopsis opalescens]PRX97356.1 hypothetical protein CLV72_106393 [Allonocardiopsis opalescens]
MTVDMLGVSDYERVTAELSCEFSGLPETAVHRCVSNARACARHLGIAVTPDLVAGIAREHLQGIAKSQPPSGPPTIVGPGRPSESAGDVG